MNKTRFFDILDRKPDIDTFLARAGPAEDYIDRNGYVLPYDYGDPEAAYLAIHRERAIFDDSPLRKVRIAGDDAGPLPGRLHCRSLSIKLKVVHCRTISLCSRESRNSRRCCASACR